MANNKEEKERKMKISIMLLMPLIAVEIVNAAFVEDITHGVTNTVRDVTGVAGNVVGGAGELAADITDNTVGVATRPLKGRERKKGPGYYKKHSAHHRHPNYHVHHKKEKAAKNNDEVTILPYYGSENEQG